MSIDDKYYGYIINVTRFEYTISWGHSDGDILSHSVKWVESCYKLDKKYYREKKLKELLS